MRRRHDWPERLAWAVDAARESPFRWGSHDCCTFVADCIEAMTGETVIEAARGRYTTEHGARAALGEGGLEALATRHLGPPLPTPALARRGDVALASLGCRSFLGIVLGDRVAAVGPPGLVFLPARTIARAWRV